MPVSVGLFSFQSAPLTDVRGDALFEMARTGNKQCFNPLPSLM